MGGEGGQGAGCHPHTAYEVTWEKKVPTEYECERIV